MINCRWTPEELEEHLSAESKRYIARNNIRLYVINAIDLAVEIGMGKRTNTILQSAFFSLAGVLPQEDAIRYMKDAATKSYLKKGQDVVDMNHRAIDAGATAFVEVEVPASWADAEDEAPAEAPRGALSSSRWSPRSWSRRPYGRRQPARLRVHGSRRRPVRAGARPLTRSAAWPSPCRRGMPRSAFSATTARSSARTPPSARSLLTDEEVACAPEATKVIPAKGKAAKGLWLHACHLSARLHGLRGLRRPVSHRCADHGGHRVGARSARECSTTAWRRSRISPSSSTRASREASSSSRCSSSRAPAPAARKPPYARLVTQLFGERMFIANATGCSSIWGGPAATSPYTVNKQGQGPAWAIPCSRTTPSTAWACCSVMRRCAAA